MKKITKTLLVASLALIAMSCSKDNNDAVTPTTVTENNVPNGTVGMSFSVQVTGSSIVGSRTAGLTGAVVTISNNGKTQTATVNEFSGLASFTGLTEGGVQIFVKAPSGYLSYNTSKYIKYNTIGSVVISSTNPGTGTGNDSQQSATETIQIPLKKIGSTVKGRVYGKFAYDGKDIFLTSGNGSKIYAILDDKNHEPNVFQSTVDGNGNFSFINLPEGLSFKLDLDYQNTFTPATGSGQLPEQRDWNIDSPNQTSLNYNEVRELGNVYVTQK